VSLEDLLPQTLTVKRKATTDSNLDLRPDTDTEGNPTYTAVSTTSLSYKCRVEPAGAVFLETGGREFQAGAPVNLSERSCVVGDPAADIRPSDRVEVDGSPFDVVGPPAVIYGDHIPHHMLVALRAVS